MLQIDVQNERKEATACVWPEHGGGVGVMQGGGRFSRMEANFCSVAAFPSLALGKHFGFRGLVGLEPCS